MIVSFFPSHSIHVCIVVVAVVSVVKLRGKKKETRNARSIFIKIKSNAVQIFIDYKSNVKCLNADFPAYNFHILRLYGFSPPKSIRMRYSIEIAFIIEN